MKKNLLFILILIILPIVSAIEFDIKTEFDQQETLMARVSGNFLEPITKENIFFYKGHVQSPTNYDVIKIEDEFYIYAQLSGKSPSNYSIVLENIKYTKLGQVSEEDITQEFIIINKTTDFSIKPGFIITNKDFFIEVTNWQDSEIEISINLNGEGSTNEGFFASLFESSGNSEDKVSVKSGQTEKINFELKNITQAGLKTITLSTDNTEYEIPIYVYTNQTLQKQKNYRFQPKTSLRINMATKNNKNKTIYLYNTGEETLENISISASNSLEQYVSLSLEEIDELESNESVKIELTITSGENEETIAGQIKAKTGDGLYAYLPIILNFVKDYVPKSEDDEEIEDPANASKTCAEMDGIICTGNQECDEEEKYTRDGKCCLGICKEKSKPSSTGKFIGWLIVIVIIITLIWFFKSKYRGTKRKIDLFEIAKGKKH